MESLIKIELTPERATFFRECCRHEEEIKILLRKKAFETRNGKVIIHFDKIGLATATVEVVLYKRKRLRG